MTMNKFLSSPMIIILSLMFIIFSPLKLQAYVGGNITVNDIHYLVLTENSKTKTGTVAISGCSYNIAELTIPNSIKWKSFIYDVTSIKPNAFYKHPHLRSVIINNNVTSIGSSAFFECSTLSNVKIPDSVTYIGHSVFHGCCS